MFEQILNINQELKEKKLAESMLAMAKFKWFVRCLIEMIDIWWSPPSNNARETFKIPYAIHISTEYNHCHNSCVYTQYQWHYKRITSIEMEQFVWNENEMKNR